jgi:lathosterol oxidase
MCIEYAFKRGGISLIRNFLHQSEGVSRGLPKAVQTRLKIGYRLRDFTNGKVTNVRCISIIVMEGISDYTEAFPAKGDRK